MVHEQQETGPTESARTGAARCPRSGSEGKPVKSITVRAILKPGLRDQVRDETYRFCGDVTCEVVYFTTDGQQVFTKDDIAVRVGIKESQPPRPLCYCFGHSVESIRAEVASTGRTTAVESIKSQIKAGGCRCEVTNPRGGCCLEDVAAAAKQLQGTVIPSASIPTASLVSQCRENVSVQPESSTGAESCCRVRPGKSFRDDCSRPPAVPDWTVVTSLAARQAIQGVLNAGWHGESLADLNASAIRVLTILLRLYAASGRPPSETSIAAASSMAQDDVRQLLGNLHQHDLVILDAADRTIHGAYPFTETITGHTVEFTRTTRVLNTMCFVDALGAPAMCREDAVIRSTCRTCGIPIVAHLCDEGTALGEIRPPDTVVWVSFKASCGCAADSLCQEILPFCCDEHLDRWRASGHTGEGRRLSIEEATQVGQALFANRAGSNDTELT